jgi:pimeloyl-ACP methyl ester carboxylesterase
MPALIVHGDSDIVPPVAVQQLPESIQGSKYVLIKDCGHFPYVEAPDELFKTINEFLNP